MSEAVELERAVIDPTFWKWLSDRDLCPDPEPDGSVDWLDIIAALDEHEVSLLGDKPASLTGEGEPVAQDAKDAEITSLRADITALEDGNMTFLCDQLDKAKAENARMREALGRITAIENEDFGGDWDEINRARKIARQALKAG